MKKRIISLILVAVMAVLTLASCGFSYSNETLDGKYTEFDATSFATKLAAIKVEDGEFSAADPAKREKMVMDAIYTAIAGKADTEKKLVGKDGEAAIGEHDLVYYCYYVTATIDGVEYMFMTDKMKTAAAVKVQLGQQVVDEEDTLTNGLLEVLPDFKFAENAVYAETTEGKVVAGQYVYVSYVRTKTEADNSKTTETVINERIQVTEEDEFTKQLIDKNIGVSEIAGITDVDGWKYDDVYVKYAEKTGSDLNGGEGYTIEGVVAYPKEDNPDGKKVDATFYAGTDSTKKSIDLVDKELTYHIFPTHYVKIDDYSIATVLNKIYGSGITVETLAKIVLQKAYIDLLDEDGHAHDNEDAIEALYDSIMVKDADDKEVDLKELAELLQTVQSTFSTAEKAYKDALKAYNNAYDAYKEAYEKYTEALTAKNEADAKVNTPETGTAAILAAAKAAYDTEAAKTEVKAAYDALKAALDATTEPLTTATTERDAAKKALDDAKAAAEAAPDDADKQTALAAAQTAYDTAEAKYQTAKTANDNAKTAFDADPLRKLEVAKDEAEAENKAANDALTSKTSAWKTAWTTLKAKRTAFATARKTYDGTPDYYMSDLDAGYEEKKAAYDAALEALLAVDKNNAEELKAKKNAFIEARKAFSINPDDPTTTDVETDNAPTNDLTPVDDNYKEDKGKKGPYDEALDKRDTIVGNFEAKIAEKEINFLFGYEYYIQYKGLEDAYNKEIKTAVAKKVYNEVIKVVAETIIPPQSEIDKVYNELIDNFQFFFYENYDLEKWIKNGGTPTARSSNDKRYYDIYGASFERFMIEEVAKVAYGVEIDVKASGAYDKAKGCVRDQAATIVNERLQIFAAAEYLKVKFTDETLRQYAKDNKDIENIFEYDGSVVERYRLAYQLELVLDTILGIEEKLADAPVGDKGYTPTNVTYNATYFPNGVK